MQATQSQMNYTENQRRQMHTEVMDSRQKRGLTFKDIFEKDDGYTKWLLDHERQISDPQLLRYMRYAKDRQALNK